MDDISGLAIIKVLDKKAQNTMMLKTKMYMKFGDTRCNK